MSQVLEPLSDRIVRVSKNVECKSGTAETAAHHADQGEVGLDEPPGADACAISVLLEVSNEVAQLIYVVLDVARHPLI